MSKNNSALLLNWPYKTTTYCKSSGKPKLQIHLTRNYDFVFTNLFKNEAELWERLSIKMCHLQTS